jgi:acid phosphatase type 7
LIACAAAGPAFAGPRMLKGPYLQDLAPNSITVMWQLDQPDEATLTIAGPGGSRSQRVDPARIAEARVEGLQPASRYRYTVKARDTEWHGEFATAPEVGADVPFSFVVFGDTRYNIAAHRRVIEQVSREVPDFVLGTGDMVDEGHKQEQWQQFFDVENELLRDNVFFPALGNHDRQGRGRTADTYRSYFSVPDNGSESERYYAFSYASGRFIVLDSNEYSFALTDQTAWLERELMAARQDQGVRHIFIVTDLRERWTPLFEKYAVTAVFSGHDHVYTRADHNGIRYFVTGGGGAPVYPRRPRSAPIDVAAVKKFERVHHYLRVNVTSNRIEITGVRSDGTTIETSTWTEGPPSAPDKPAIRAVGAGATPAIAPAVAPLAKPTATRAGTTWPVGWLGLGAMGLLLGAAVFVVRSLRR